MSVSLDTLSLDLLDKLLHARGGPVDPAGLARELSVDPQALRQAELELTSFGCELAHEPGVVRLVRSGLGVWSDYLSNKLQHTPARTVEVYQRTTSTQDLVKARAGEALLILANEQTGGRGRLGRSWTAPPGTGLLFSMSHQVDQASGGSVDRVSFLTAVAVAQAVESLTADGLIQVRWPNDIVVNRRKLAGILVESVRGRDGKTTVVIGVGINVGLDRQDLMCMPAELRDSVTSFALEGWRADRLLIAERVIGRIDHHLRQADLPELIHEWRTRNLYRDQTLTFLADGQAVTGTVMDLDPDHGLIVRRDTGEIIHLPTATTSVVK